MHDNPPELSAAECLRRFLVAPDEAGSARELDMLMERFARPVVVRTVRAKLRALGPNGFFNPSGDVEDIFGDACLRLVAKLRTLRERSDAEPIGDFENYAAVVAINAVNDYLKAHSPKRVSLRNRLRYLLEKLPDYDLRPMGGDAWASKAQGSTDVATASPEEILAGLRGTATATLRERVDSVFVASGGAALRLNDLARIVAELEGIGDEPPAAIEDWHHAARPEESAVAGIEARSELRTIWAEITRLPSRQRIALLYNLADERRGEMLFMFFNARIAGIGDIADALGVGKEECAALLPQLPFEDKRIAEEMGITPKQVANLRKAARDNLRRRLAGIPRRTRKEDKR